MRNLHRGECILRENAVKVLSRCLEYSTVARGGQDRQVNSGKVPAWRWMSRAYGPCPIGGTYHERVTVMVQFLGTTTRPANIARPGSSLVRFVGGPIVSSGRQRPPSGSVIEGGSAPG